MDYIEIENELNECIVCFDPMKKKDSLMYCTNCSNYMHCKCYIKWSKKNIDNKDKCLYCQQKGMLVKKRKRSFLKILSKFCC